MIKIKVIRKIWYWLYKICLQEIKKCHMKIWNTDIKCPNCNEWFSVSGVMHKHEHVRKPNSDLSEVVCGQCGHHSFWSAHLAPCLVLVDENGKPLK